MKKTDLYALSFAAMLAASMSTANAADLGGNCCADLEERVAELEATVVKKGNRKVSLTLSGQVNKMITYWSAGNAGPVVGAAPTAPTGAVGAPGIDRIAGRASGTYLGLDNQNSSTRFGLAGSAKINSDWSAGYSILIDVTGGARSNAFSQLNEDSSLANANQYYSGVSANNGDYGLRMRDANWWLQNERVGRLTVGRLTSSGAVGMIDLGGIGVIASVSHGLIGGGLLVVNQAGAGSGRTMNNLTDASGDYNFRGDGVKWTSPTIQGFVLSAAVIETLRESKYIPTALDNRDGRNIGIDLKYANEFNGVRVAWGIGYETGNDAEQTPLGGGNVLAAEITTWGTSLALLHTATGLFIQGDYINKEVTGLTAAATLPTASRDANRWNIQAGMQRNFFGIGNTNLYGEYGRGAGWLEVNRTQATGIADNGVVLGIDSKYSVWGLGVVQNVDAAAMELYMGYRSFKFSEGGNAAYNQSGIDTFSAGARIKF
jgi:hypothetical protein